MDNCIFDGLFVFEIANNHWGKVERGVKIINDYAKIANNNEIKCAIKLQIRNVDGFIHKDFRDRQDIRYIKKTIATKMSLENYAVLVDAIRKNNCLAMATPFDEKSVEMCEKLELDIIKIASSDINDRVLIERIAKTKKPVIVSTGGASTADIDKFVTFFTECGISIAINHCVSLYPTPKENLELNQIDFLRKRYPNLVIGFSTHEYNERADESIMLAYAKGARTFERHVDIDADGIRVSPYCTLPEDMDLWIKGYKRAVAMCGGGSDERRDIPAPETEYLDALVRGVCAARDLKKGHVITDADIYLSIPLRKGQISCREYLSGEKLLQDISIDAPVGITDVESAYSTDKQLIELIQKRGL
ncbi:hypothetical protein FACS189449_07000 [Alphaproteobacteria bacterium]|nr:hypothetical protein FACS189449_07000 [Alphaproteobacteria bacterium]